MPEQVHDGRAVLVEQINTQLNMFLSSIKTAIQNNLPNRNVLAETTLMGLLNRIHGWDLVNANSIRQNFPGIDLIDTVRKIGIQITSTNTLNKVDNTLKKVANLPDDVEIDHLHIIVITSDTPTSTMKERKQAPYFSGSDDIWNISTLLRQIMDLPVSKLEDIRTYLDGELGTIQREMTKKYLNLPLSSALDKDSFVGRETEMEEIRKKLHSGAKPIVLSGLGGMGKTELAVRFGLNYGNGNVYFIRFSESFTATVTAMFRGVCPQPQDPPPEAEQYKTVMSLLAECTEKDILIIDNVDADSGTLRDLMKDQTYKQLNAMKLRLILTTRFDEARSVGVRPMPNETLYEIFGKHGAFLEKSQMDKLIEAVNGHTLTIDLMARILNGKGWRKVTPETLLNDLRTNALPGANYKKITSDYNQSEDQAQIYQHLSVVFDATHIPEDAKNVLRCAILLPEGGMNGEYFHEALTEEQQQQFETLIEHGWLNAEDGVITIHPVIRLVCRVELTPNEESCGTFLDALWGQFDPIKHERVKFAQMAEVFAAAMDIDGRPETKANWLNSSGRLLGDLMECRKATALYERYIPELEQKIPTHPALATAYNNMGSTYGEMGDHPKALEYKLKDLEICEKVLPPEHPSLATSYSNVGTTYGNLGDHNKALEYQLKALVICEKVLPPEHPSLATSYGNVCATYYALGDHNKALEYQLKALEIWEKVLPPEHPDFAISYNNVGCTYDELGDHAKALKYKLKSLEICEKVLPVDHPSLAAIYNSLGYTYGKVGDHAKALEYLLKALAIREKVLSPEHPSLATSYNNMGTTYCALGDHNKALEYQMKALAIKEKVLSPEHPDLALSYNNIGVTYANLEQFSKAAEYLEKALAIFEKSLPKGHSHTESTRRSIEALRTWMH